MDAEKVFRVLIEEHSRLRAEICEVNKNQFQIVAAVSLGVVGGFGAWIGFLRDEPKVLLLLGSLALAQILFSLEFRLRTKALSHRLSAIERQLQAVCETESVMRWECTYVPQLFGSCTPLRDGMHSIGRVTRLFRNLMIHGIHAAFLLPLFLIYFLCLMAVWMVRMPFPAYWTVGGVLGLLVVLLVYRAVEVEFDRRICNGEKDMETNFQCQINRQTEVK